MKAGEGAGEPYGRVYVLLVNWKGWADTIECLESVLWQKYPEYRVIVCDNASSDDSLARIQAWADGQLSTEVRHPLRQEYSPPAAKPVHWVEYDRTTAERGGNKADGDPLLTLIHSGGNLGFAGGNNIGLRYALARGDSEYVWLLNNDTVADPDALRAMVDAARVDSTIGVVGSKLLYYEEPSVIQAIAGGALTPWKGTTRLLGRDQRDVGQWEGRVDLDYVTGASMLVRTDVVRSVGLMDEGYFLYSEEVDWCLRARQQKWRLVYAPGSCVWHKEGRSTGRKSPTSDYYGVRSSLLLVRKFFPHLLLATVLYSFYRSLLPKVVRLQPRRLRAVLRAYRDFFFAAVPESTDRAG